MSTLNENIKIISDQIGIMKTKLGLVNTASLQEVVDAIGSGSGTSTDIYKVKTIEERNAINANENDMCIVINSSISNINVNTEFQIAKFPSTVILPEAVTNSIDVSFRPVDTSVMFDCFGMLDSSSFGMDCFTDSGSIRISYTSTDGITYTRTDGGSEDIDFGTTIKYAYQDMWNDTIGYFIKVGSTTFDGIFTYKNNAWNYTDIGISTNNNNILTDYKAYTNNGIIMGTFPESSLNDMKMLCEAIDRANSNNITTLNNVFKNCQATYGDAYSVILKKCLMNTSIEDISEAFNGSLLTGKIDLSDVDISNITNINHMFMLCGNVEEIIMPAMETPNLVYGYYIFAYCSNLKKVDMSKMTLGNITNVSSWFQNCTSLQYVDIRNMEFSKSNVTSYSFMFNKVPTDCLIIVKNEAEKNILTSKFSNMTNIKTVGEL